MTAPSIRTPRGRLGGIRRGGALTATLALAGLVVIGSPGAARAASPNDSYNQITGVGTTASALTVDWTQGLRDSHNQPITAPGIELAPNSDRSSGTGPLSFMYSDFKNLQVTVSQTQNITHQGITVKWTGGTPSAVATGPRTNFLQMMECWGDLSTGPSPEDCEYGSASMLGHAANPGVGDRAGYFCPTGDPSTANPPSGPPGVTPDFGCDSYERPGLPTSENPPHCDPQAPPGLTCDHDSFFDIPFVPVDDQEHPIYEQSNLPAAFDEFNTNEVQSAVTGANKGGQKQFETLTSVQAPHLGCGQLESNGQPRGCWLVIVPRGEYEPNGFHVTGGSGEGGWLETSPLSAANWAQRIQVHLSYTPLASNCPPTILPRQVVGTAVISRAMSSWEFALNQAAKCNRIFVYTATTEGTSTDQLSTAGAGNAGLAFTTIPIGSEATRSPGGHPPALPPMLYAPVAVTALGFGFNIDEGGGGSVITPVKLTPRLLAKALTQTYRYDLPDVIANDPTHPGPSWALHNPGNITLDPVFQQLNPEITPSQASRPFAPLLTVDRSALNQQVWQWIQSDPATNSWLDGTPDKADPVKADPDYVALHLGKAPAIDSYPRAYSGVLDEGPCHVDTSECSEAREKILQTADILPFAADYDAAAATVLAGSDTGLSPVWDPTAQYSDGSFGWWDPVGVLPQGQIFMSAASDMPDLAAYGLIAAQYCAPSGSNCVVPSLDSVTKALGSATTDAQGLLQVNPAKVPAGGYPLVDVVYAAVPIHQDPVALTDYADLIQYAIGGGQVTGSNPGDLPPGYLPLPKSLKDKAQAVVNQLRAIAHPTPTPTHTGSTGSGSGSGSGTGSGSGNGPGTGTGSGTGSGTGTGSGSGATSPALGSSGSATSGSPASHGPVYLAPSATLAGGTTPRQSSGSIRWVLVAVLLIGAGGALGGGLLRSDRLTRWLSRGRT